MKKYIVYGLLLIAYCLLITPVSAQDIQTGNSSVQSTVTNTVNGSGCQTHIEVIVNGVKKVLDSTDCGTHSLNVNSNSNSQSPLPSSSVFIPQKPTLSLSPSPTSTVTPTIKPAEKKEIHESSFIVDFINTVSDFFKRILRNI